MNKKKAIISWILVGILMFIIFYFSHQASQVSSGTSSGLTRELFDLFNLDEYLIFDSFHGLIRKIAHFIIYFILGFLVYNAVSFTFKKDYIEFLLYTILIVMVYAFSDEIHQLFIVGRSGELRDVFIDTSGGSIGGLIYYFYLKIGCVRTWFIKKRIMKKN